MANPERSKRAVVTAIVGGIFGVLGGIWLIVEITERVLTSTEIEPLTHEINQWKGKHDSLEKEMIALRAERASLAADVGRLNEALTRESGESARAQAQLEAARKENAALEKDTGYLRSRVDNLTERVADFEQKNQELLLQLAEQAKKYEARFGDERAKKLTELVEDLERQKAETQAAIIENERAIKYSESTASLTWGVLCEEPHNIGCQKQAELLLDVKDLREANEHLRRKVRELEAKIIELRKDLS